MSEREQLPDCVGCRKPLFVGDMGFAYEDELCCAECAPTYEQAKAEWEEQKDEPQDNPEAYAEFCKSYDAHMPAGGKPSDQCVAVL